MLFCYRCYPFGGAGTVGAEDELYAVLLDEPLGQLPGASRCGFVIVVLYPDLIVLVVDLDAAHLIDAFDRKVVAVLGVLAVGGVLPREGKRRPEGDSVSLNLGDRRTRNNETNGGHRHH